MPNAHARRSIISSAVTLVTGLETTGSNVFEDPAAAIADGVLPAIVVEATSEEVDPVGESLNAKAYNQRRVLRLSFTVISKSITSRENSTLEIEEAIMGSSLGLNRRVLSTEFESNSEGSTRLWSASISVEVVYMTLSTKPRTEV